MGGGGSQGRQGPQHPSCQPLPNSTRTGQASSPDINSQDTLTCGRAEITAMDPLDPKNTPEELAGWRGEAFILTDTPALVSSLVQTWEADSLEAGH